ncbi:MAG TPA: radical SAM protein [Armatimonadetes bacterium]|nr:radical SAM protein [Armatimonadota bacterium]
MKYIYGPVPSRRLGASLGIDIAPYKTCSFDCIYCQLGRTTHLCRTPMPLINSADAMRELEEWLDRGQRADYITFAGSGEPTLNSDLGVMIDEAKRLTNIPVAVITNGSLFSDPSVRDSVIKADLLVPSLDAGCQATFDRINRPRQGMQFREIVQGLIDASSAFHNELWLEVMLVKGVNDSDAELSLMRDIIAEISPDRVQINTVDRPSRSGNAEPVSEARLFEACRILYSNCDVVVHTPSVPASGIYHAREEDLLNLLRRRPCKIDDICTTLGLHAHETSKMLRSLSGKQLITYADDLADPFYQAVPYVREQHDV